MNDTIEKIMRSLVGVKAPQRKFLLILFTVIMCRVGRANFRNMSRFSQMSEKTFSRWYRRPFDFVTFNTRFLKEEGIGDKSLVAAVDASFLSKSGKSTDGLGYFWNGSSSRSEQGRLG